MSEAMTEAVSEAAAGLWRESLRRLALLATLLACFTVSVAFMTTVPLRVGAFGPADPILLRGLGAWFFETGTYATRAAANLTAPLLALLLASLLAGILGIGVLNRPIALPRLLFRALISTSVALIVVSAWIVGDAYTLLLALAL